MILFVLFSFDVRMKELLSLPEAAEHDLSLDFYDTKLITSDITLPFRIFLLPFLRIEGLLTFLFFRQGF